MADKSIDCLRERSIMLRRNREWLRVTANIVSEVERVDTTSSTSGRNTQSGISMNSHTQLISRNIGIGLAVCYSFQRVLTGATAIFHTRKSVSTITDKT